MTIKVTKRRTVPGRCFIFAACICASLEACGRAAPAAIPGHCGGTNLPSHLQIGLWTAPRHRSWRLPNDHHLDWYPFATGGHRTLMVRSTGFSPAAGTKRSFAVSPLHMATVRDGSKQFVPIAAGAYPQRATLGAWRLDWPWVVGVWWTTPHAPPGPFNWRLTAGNVITGKRVVLDSARSDGGYPTFQVNGGRVVWAENHDTDVARRSRAWISVFTLKTGLLQKFAYSTETGVLYSDPALSGRRLVFVRSAPHSRRPLTDVIEVSLALGSRSSVVNITHNWVTKGTDGDGVSYEPALWRNLVIFEQAPSPDSQGIVFLTKLEAGRYPVWTEPGRVWRLDRDGIHPQFGSGIAIWQSEHQATLGILDANEGRVWLLQNPRRIHPGGYRYQWSAEGVGGRDILMRRAPWGGPWQKSLAFFVWRVPSACAEH
jgi:hypothetical protein